MTRFLSFLIMVMLGIILVAPPVLASASPAGGGAAAPADNNETSISYKADAGGTKTACPKFSSVIMSVTYCVQIAMVNATQLFLQPVSDMMLPITGAVLALVVGIFGFKLAMGETELNRKTFTLLIKIGCVLMFGYNFGGWMLPTFGATISLQDAVVTTLWKSPNCPISSFTAGAPSYDYISAGGANVWATLDCIIGKLFGFGGTFIMATSIFGMLGSLIGSGTMGAMVFFFGLTTLLSIFFFAIRAVYTFLISYVFIGFLIIISPMVMPLMLFRNTYSMFDAWLKNLMVAIMIPAVIFTYLCMVMPLLDEVVMGNDQASLKNVVSDEKMSGAYRNLQQRCSMASQSTDFSFFRQMSGSMNIEQWVQGPFRNTLIPSNSAATDPCQSVQTPSMDFGQGQVMTLWDIAFSLLRIFLIGILISMMMNMLPDLVVAWVRGGRAAQRASESPLPGQQMLNSALSQMQRRISGGSRGGGGGGVFGSLVGRR